MMVGAQDVPGVAAMGRRHRGGRRAGADRRFEVASVLEDLVRDVEALWFCRGGPDDVDFDRCDHRAFCEVACFSEWDRYGPGRCHSTRPCAFCDPECSAARGRLRPLSRLIPSNRLAAPCRVVSPSIGSSKLLSETIWRLFAACQLFLVSYFTIMQSITKTNEIVIVIELVEKLVIVLSMELFGR
eukprot:COSAG02_NODE_118_length_35376_cov_20.294923_18_plen_185_part_00